MKREIKRTLERGMTVADLIAELDGMDPDARVVFVCDYGDYCHTQQALVVNNIDELDTTSLVESAYSHSGMALVGDDDDDPEFYCPACDEESVTPVCRKCHGACVNDDGTPAQTDDDEPARAVVILR